MWYYHILPEFRLLHKENLMQSLQEIWKFNFQVLLQARTSQCQPCQCRKIHQPKVFAISPNLSEYDLVPERNQESGTDKLS